MSRARSGPRTPPCRVSESDLLRLLNARFCPPAWAFLWQVANGTGSHKTRTIDGLAMSLWPSRGLHLHGFEVKVSRGDWQRELRDPQKADGLAQACHAFWVVAPKEVVLPGELPPTWGHLVPHGTGLRVERDAPVRLDVAPLPWSMLAAVLRSAAAHVETTLKTAVPRDEIAAELEKARLAGIEEGKKQIEWAAHRALTDLPVLQERVKAFEEASGVKVNVWNAGDIGKAVKVVLADGLELRREALSCVRDQAACIVADINATLKRTEGA